MSQLVANMQHLRTETSAHCLGVHHPTKADPKNMRGSGALPAGCDMIMNVLRDEESKISTATIEKQREGEAGQRFNYKLEPMTLGLNPLGKAITACAVDHILEDIVVGKPRERLTAQQAEVYNAIASFIAQHGVPAIPLPGMAPVRCVDIKPLLDSLDLRGVLYAEDSVTDSVTDSKTASGKKRNQKRNQIRALFHRYKIALKRKGYLAFTKHKVWLLREGVTDA